VPPIQQLHLSIRASAASSAICCVNRRSRKYAIVLSRPSASRSCGSQRSTRLARRCQAGAAWDRPWAALEDERAARAGQLQDPGGEIVDGELAGFPILIGPVKSSSVAISRVMAFDKIVDVAEASRLRAVP